MKLSEKFKQLRFVILKNEFNLIRQSLIINLMLRLILGFVVLYNLNCLAQYQAPIEIYSDSLETDFHPIKSFLLSDFNDNNLIDVMASQQITDSNFHIGYFAQNSNINFSGFNTLQSDLKSIDDNIFHVDLDGDLDKDLIYVSDFDELIIHYNLGSGSYSNADIKELPIDGLIRNFRVNDINDIDKDGDNDLVITRYKDKMYSPLEDSSTVWIGINDGDANFSFEMINEEFTAAIYEVRLGDFDNDDDLDLLTIGFGFSPDFGIEVPSYLEPFFRWYKNEDGNFSSSVELPIPERVERVPSVSDFQIADLEGDGIADIFASFAVRDTCEDQVHAFNCSFIYVFSIYKYDSISAQIVQINELNSWPHNYLIEDNFDYYKDYFKPFYADYNNDGNIDILTANTITNNIYWLLGDGTGSFNNQIVVAPLNNFDIRPKLKAKDLDFDGDLDIVSLLDADSLNVLQYYENTAFSDNDFDNDGIVDSIDCDDNDAEIGSVLPHLNYENSMDECIGNEVQFTTTNKLENASYNWFGPNNFYALLAEPTLVNLQLDDEGVYSVFATLNHCVSDTSEIELHVLDRAEVTLNLIGDSLVADYFEFTGYKWYLNNELLNDVYSNVFYPIQSGFYQVETINDLGCIFKTDSLLVNINTLKNNNLVPFNVYPNPINSANYSVLNFDVLESKSPILIEIIDVVGNLKYASVLHANKIDLQMLNLETGLYIIQLSADDFKYYTQLIVY